MIGARRRTEAAAQGGDGAKPDDVDRGQGFGEAVVADGVGRPVGEVVRRLGRDPDVLLQETMGVVVDRGLRDLADPVPELGQGPGPPAQKDDLTELDEEAERRSHGQASFFISETIFPAQR